MSLRWIQENQEAPICDEESSDIDDTSCDDSDDHQEATDRTDSVDQNRRKKRETFRHPTTTVSLKDIRMGIGLERNRTKLNLRKEALNKLHDPNVLQQMGNPTYDSVMQLHSMTGYRLVILPCGKIYGFDCSNNPFAQLKVTSSSPGVVQIRGIETGLYLAFNERGQLYGEKNKDKDNTMWKHLLIGSYDSYLSVKYSDRDWYVGIKKNGRPKNGHKTAINQKATKFLPIRSS